MGWFSKAWKKVKNVFKKVSKVVKKVVKSVSKAAKKVWDGTKDIASKAWSGIKKGAKKLSKGISKLGPFANIAMNFIPGFGQLWAAYGVWGQIAKGALVGYATTGEASGALLGAIGGGFSHAWNNMPGNTIAEKLGGAYDNWTNTTPIDRYLAKAGTTAKPYGYKGYKGSRFKGNDVDKFLYNFDKNEFATGGGPVDMGDPGFQSAQSRLHKLDAYKNTGPYVNKFAQDSLLNRHMDTEYGGQTPKASWVDKLRQGTSAYSALKGEGGYADSSNPLGYNAYDTSALTAYDTTAGGSRGQVGTGTDVYDVNKLGLLAAIDRIRRSEQEFGVA